MSILDNEGHDPNGLGNRPAMDMSITIDRELELLRKIEKLVVERATLTQALAEAREVIEPFAEWITLRDKNYTTSGYPDTVPLTYSPDNPNRGAATVGDLRRARAWRERNGACDRTYRDAVDEVNGIHRARGEKASKTEE